jgi:hypothetical protein
MQASRLAELADIAGVSQSEFMRSLLDSATGGGVKAPKPRRESGTMLQLVEIHELAMQVRKLGTNVNQLARQANAGLVPPEEVVNQSLVRLKEVADPDVLAQLNDFSRRRSKGRSGPFSR